MAKIIRSRLSIIGLMATAGCVPFAAAQVYPEVAPQFTMFDSSGSRAVDDANCEFCET